MSRSFSFFKLRAPALVLTTIALALLAPAPARAASYPDVMLGAFWNSDSDLSDTLYMSYNGVDFQQISVPYPTDGNYSDHVTGMPSYVHALHDPGLFYLDGNFWMVSGFVQNQPGLGYRFTPMLGSSKDLVHWSYPNSGSATNLAPTVMPDGARADGGYDTAGTDAFADDDGTVWIVTTLGYFAMNHGDSSLNDVMSPYIVRVDNLRPGADQQRDPGAQPQLTYGSLVPINLPDSHHDWLDPSLYKENGTYYLSIKRDGITNQIYAINDLSRASDASAWRLVCSDVVTGYEGPSLAKYNGQYFMYTDKLKDYPLGTTDTSTGNFVTQSGSLSGGWTNTRRITTSKIAEYNGETIGITIPNRHGSVIAVTDPKAKELIFELRESLGYGAYEPGLNGWQERDGKVYWYDDGIMSRYREIYDPGTDAWYWIDADGTRATNKDAYIPAGDKWVRYDENGGMVKGLEFRYGSWYYFDPITGEMLKGNVWVPEWNAWHWFDLTTGRG